MNLDRLSLLAGGEAYQFPDLCIGIMYYKEMRVLVVTLRNRIPICDW
jgi:hypothetical protein